MAYTGNPSTNPIDAVRLTVQDTDPVFFFLADNEYQYFLDKNNQNISRTSKEVARVILFKLASYVRERADVLEVYGSDYFKQYKVALDMFLKEAQFGDVASAMPYAGGISRSDIESNISDLDNYTVPVEKGVPVEYTARNVNADSPFNKSNLPRSDAFDV